jgi:hypothetical protein
MQSAAAVRLVFEERLSIPKTTPDKVVSDDAISTSRGSMRLCVSVAQKSRQRRNSSPLAKK